MTSLKKLYCRIPDYGQLILRKGQMKIGWFQSAETETYYSLMLKGVKKKGWFRSSTFYLVFTEHCFEEALKRGRVNAKYMTNPVPFGKYTGIQHIENARHAKNSYDVVFLNVFRYVRGGGMEDAVIAMSERQFRRAIIRAKQHPELIVRRRFWHGLVQKIYRKMSKFAES